MSPPSDSCSVANGDVFHSFSVTNDEFYPFVFRQKIDDDDDDSCSVANDEFFSIRALLQMKFFLFVFCYK